MELLQARRAILIVMLCAFLIGAVVYVDGRRAHDPVMIVAGLICAALFAHYIWQEVTMPDIGKVSTDETGY